MARTDRLSQPGPRKFLSDSLAVLEIHALPMIRQWYLIVLGTLVFPIPMFYVFQSIAPDDAAVWQRLLAGTLIFGVSFSTAMLVGQQIVAQRFMGHLKLVITMPVSKAAYVVGTLAYTAISGTLSAVFLLGFAFIAGVEIEPTWALAPALLLTVLALAGLVLFVMSFAPSLPVGNIIASAHRHRAGHHLAGVLHAWSRRRCFCSGSDTCRPCATRPTPLPPRLGGRVDVWLELAVLAAYAIVAMGLGLWRLPWRET